MCVLDMCACCCIQHVCLLLARHVCVLQSVCVLDMCVSCCIQHVSGRDKERHVSEREKERKREREKERKREKHLWVCLYFKQTQSSSGGLDSTQRAAHALIPHKGRRMRPTRAGYGADRRGKSLGCRVRGLAVYIPHTLQHTATRFIYRTPYIHSVWAPRLYTARPHLMYSV